MKQVTRGELLSLLLSIFLSIGLVNGHESTLHAYESAVVRSANFVSSAPCEISEAESCKIRIRLRDVNTGESLAGLLRIRSELGCRVLLDPLLNRGIELASDHEAQSWSAVLQSTEIEVPRTVVTIEAFSGLETEMTRRTLDLRDHCPAELTLPISRFYDAGRNDWHSGNTHLHIRNLSRQESDRYLTTIPKADDLDLVFVSYLERVQDDKAYISNEYGAEDLRRLASSELDFGWGEELRHYFGPYGEGYGHVLLLNLQELVRPVSLGPGLTGRGDDGLPVRRGMAEARQQGGSVVWCHNTFGFEDIPNWLDGLVDAQNIFDGGSEGSYEDSFYNYLNIGLRIPFSTGTDWFMYDFSRVYVRMATQLSVKAWLDALVAGESFITNGTFLELSLGSKHPGDELVLAEPISLPLKASALGRNDFGALELIYNGSVIDRTRSRVKGGHYEASLETRLRLEKSGWLATRIVGGEKNEMGADLFAHTSPIYIEVAGQRILDPDAAEKLIREMENAIETIPTKAIFTEPSRWERIRQIYEDGMRRLQDRLD